MLPRLTTSSAGSVSRAWVVALATVAGCASAGWPDERGVDVTTSRAANVESSDQFLDRLSEQRRAAGRSPPVLVDPLQPTMLAVAASLQRGDISATMARSEAARLVGRSYGHAVDAWVVDCAPGAAMSPPGRLVSQQTTVIAYAAAHFRPRSMTAEQCGVVVVAVPSADHVRLEAP